MSLFGKAKDSFLWSALIQTSFQLIGFVVSIILARILQPSDFGIVGIIGIFIALGRSILDGGLAASLIRQKESSQLDYSTVFMTNAFIALVCYFLLYLSTPVIAAFFFNPYFS